MNLLRVLPFSAASLLLLSIGCGSSPSSTTTTPPVPTLYVVQSNNSTTNASSVLEFPANAQGSITPTATINAPTGFIFTAVAVDVSGNIYVAAYNLDTTPVNEILVYAPGATGAASPMRTLILPMTPGAIAVDATGQIYALLYAGGEINIYAAGATGNAAPLRQINGSMTMLTINSEALSLAVDSAQNIYVANNFGQNVLVFSSTANGNVMPSRVLAGNATGLDWPSGITVDAAGDIFTTSDFLNSQVLLEFAPGANGDVAPIRALDSTSARLFLGVAVDAAGNLYTVNENPATGVPSIIVFSPTESGITAPTATITSTAWTASYGQIAIH